MFINKIFNPDNKKIVIFSILSLCLVIYILISNYFELLVQQNGIQTIVKPVSLKNLTLLEEYCEVNGEWTTLGEFTYFKKSLAYYFTDRKAITLNVLHNSDHQDVLNFDLKLIVHIISKTKKFDSIHIKLKKYRVEKNEHHISVYADYTIIIDFDLLSFLWERNLNYSPPKDLTLTLDVIDSRTEENIRAPLELKLENFRETNKSGSMVCSKFLLIDDARSFADFKTWVKLLRLQGYHKVVVHNRPIPFHKDIQDYLSKNADFIQVEQLKCLPNLIQTQKKEKYLVIKQVNSSKQNEEYISLDTISFSLINDCYLKNRNQYEYIAIFDPDEFILFAENLRNISYDSVIYSDIYNQTLELNKTFLNPSTVDLQFYKQTNYYNKLFHNSYKTHISILFPYVMYLQKAMMESLCRELSNKKRSDIKLNVKVHYNVGSNMNASTNIQILNAQERSYADYLCQFENYTKRLLKSKVESDKGGYLNSNFDRFFYVKYNNFGKSIHNTDQVFTVHTHYIRSRIFEFNENNIGASYYSIDYNQGKTSHFKPKSNFGHLLNIKNIIFDLEYFMFIFNKLF